MATGTRKGQITLPKAGRDSLGLEPESQADFEIRAGAIVLRKRLQKTL